ncbi:Taxadiene 5-alpha hydroxylase [Actinidia chinensis var. chinensis]|uniref:Taxadiene 5-alpha hydroxylase n=1 Tax=Actinidia chinensis var. chinensis TaxID=1590841 RepID=A0A2R6QXE3_ACTCC|nr:Taxadiene 5-alpha hydroxylase [Actinidia chinensis var. chinensis]
MALEMNFLALTCVCSLLTAMISVIVLMQKKKSEKKIRKKLPPGDMGLPWIGETMEFYKAQRKNRLFEEFVQTRRAKYGKIFKTRLMGSPTIVVNGADANRFFLSNEFKLVISSWPSSSVQLMGKDSIMEKQGEAHRCLRRVIASSLSCAVLEAMVPKICHSVESHLNKYWHNKDQISLYRVTKILTFTIVFECLLGINVEQEMLGMFERVLEGVFAAPFAFPGSKFSRAKRARKEIEKVLVDIVREKKNEMEGGLEGGEREGTLLAQLVAGMIRGEISEEEVVDNVVLLVFAAHDTTSFAVAMTFRMLAHHPNCFSLLLRENNDILSKKRDGEKLTVEDTKKMKYTWQVARESMRLFPPIFGSFRKAIADIEYEGFVIPKGWKVLWTTYGTHYIEDYFPDPLAFNPSRFEEPIQPYVFLPFGGGPRVCAGYQLAKLNILIFVHYVVTRYDWSLQYLDEPIIMDPLPFPSQGMPISISPKLL